MATSKAETSPSERQSTRRNMQAFSSEALRSQYLESRRRKPRDSLSPVPPASAIRHNNEGTTLPNVAEACPPRAPSYRPSRPPALHIDSDHGHTTAPLEGLRNSILSDALSESITTILDQAIPPPSPRVERRVRRRRKSPAPPLPGTAPRAVSPAMGNQHSHHTAREATTSEDSDTHSLSSVVRPRGKGVRLPRRSSFNVFKTLDSKSPIPAGFTATVMEVPRAATAPNLDDMATEDTSEEDDEPRGRLRRSHRRSAPSPVLVFHPVQSASPATVIGRDAARPLSAVDTIETIRAEDGDMGSENSSPAALRVSALSPTLPSPSPLPEDSPHKYGLRDRMDTPDNHSPPPDIQVAKAKRRSSGLEIFNEARTLQSASSFLNGLSTARRRAESCTQLRKPKSTTQLPPIPAHLNFSRPMATDPPLQHLPTSTPRLLAPCASPPTLPPNSEDSISRALGHSTKASGFAYSLPLRLSQLKCYRNHENFLPGSNRLAPVECAVCHEDAEREMWSCSWCAVRVCGVCRKEFLASGERGLRERIKGAEMAG